MANIGFISLGCAKNQVDCERMMYRVQEAGHTVKSDVVGSDVVVINTCGFIDSAKSEAIDYILQTAALKAGGQNPGHRLPVPAVSGGHSEGNARGGRHSGYRQLHGNRSRHRKAPEWGAGGGLRLHRRTGSGNGTHHDHGGTLRLYQNRRGLRQPLLLLCHSLPSGQIPQPPDGRRALRSPDAGEQRREGADRGRPGHQPLRNGLARTQAAFAGASAEAL